MTMDLNMLNRALRAPEFTHNVTISESFQRWVTRNLF